MKTSWFNGVEKDKIEELTSSFKSALTMRNRFTQMLNSRIDKSMTESRLKVKYSSQNWALTQADSRGYERAMQEIIALFIDKT